MKKNNKKGFTLIELIVVIAILAILGIIAIPVVTGLVDDARDSSNKANRRTVELAAKAYITQNDQTIDNQTELDTAMTALGVPTAISGANVDFYVTSQGATVVSPGGTGSIVFY